jgi:hypothetical protein
MTFGLKGRIFGTFIGALCGYIIGWALGWSFFEPNLDLWALAALIGTLLGLWFGVRRGFWKQAGVLICSTIGLYLGWIFRTLLFGDVPGGLGVLLIVGGAVAGALIGGHRALQKDGKALRALTLALVVGFFGGFLIDWILMQKLGIRLEEPPILFHAPAVIFSSLVGAVSGILSVRQKRRGDSEA